MEKSFYWPPKIKELGDIVKEYIDTGKPLSIADDGGIYKELEESFSKLHNRKYGLLVSSGTMALYSAFFALDILPEDEIICTVYSYHATITPALHLGAKIIFCDVEEDTGNIDCMKIEKLITLKTKLIVTNDQWGHPCDKDKILEICKKYSLKYLEDCSHAHFSEYKGKYTGTFGDVACWSLQGNKLLSGGEGGILLTDNQEIYETLKFSGGIDRLQEILDLLKDKYHKSRTMDMPRGKRFLMYHETLMGWRKFKAELFSYNTKGELYLDYKNALDKFRKGRKKYITRTDVEIVQEIMNQYKDQY